MLSKKECPTCKNHFKVKPSHFERRIYCCKVCFNISKRGKKTPMTGRHHSQETKDKISAVKMGTKHTAETKNKMLGRIPWNKGKQATCPAWNKGTVGKMPKPWNKGKAGLLAGDKSPHWKGDSIGYYGLHAWVRKELGQPETCEFCGKANLTGKKIHWANKSRNYYRDKQDWLRLCASCHRKYDLNK